MQEILIKEINIKDLKEDVNILTPKEQHGRLEIFTQIQGVEVYVGSVFDIRDIRLKPNGILSANRSTTYIHHVKEVKILRYSKQTITYQIHTEHI